MENTLADEALIAFGAAVKLHRTAKGWSQAQLAEHMTEIGASALQSTVAKIERGSRPTPISEAAVIAYALGVPLTALLPVDEASSSLARLFGLHAELTGLLRAEREAHDMLERLGDELVDALQRWDEAVAALSVVGREMALAAHLDPRPASEYLRERVAANRADIVKNPPSLRMMSDGK